MRPFPIHPPVALDKDFRLSVNDGSCVISLPRLRTSVDLSIPSMPSPVESTKKDGDSKMKSNKTIHESMIIIKSLFIYKKYIEKNGMESKTPKILPQICSVVILKW